MNKTVYFLIDCSGSMHGQRADAVNTAMENVVADAIPEIKRLKTPDLNINFKVLGFSSNFTNNVVLIAERTLDDFDHWDPIKQETFYGGTPTGAAIYEVIKDLQGGNYGEEDKNAVAPAIVLISDGEPTDSTPSYDEVLEYADKNSPNHIRQFRKSLRVAIGINVNEQGKDSLKRFAKVSDKMEKAGIKPYYDCSEEYTDNLVEILESVTLNASIAV